MFEDKIEETFINKFLFECTLPLAIREGASEGAIFMAYQRMIEKCGLDLRGETGRRKMADNLRLSLSLSFPVCSDNKPVYKSIKLLVATKP